MAQSFLQIQRQIEVLQKHADRLRQREVAGVIERIKIAIKEHNLTPEQLGFGSSGRSVRARGVVKPKGGVVKGKGGRAAKYADDKGNTWGGVGKRPDWLRAELSAGKSLEEFLVTAASVPSKGAGRKAASKTKGRRAGKARYRDPATGKTWTGMGPQPRWLKEALAAGKTMDDFTV